MKKGTVSHEEAATYSRRFPSPGAGFFWCTRRTAGLFRTCNLSTGSLTGRFGVWDSRGLSTAARSTARSGASVSSLGLSSLARDRSASSLLPALTSTRATPPDPPRDIVSDARTARDSTSTLHALPPDRDGGGSGSDSDGGRARRRAERGPIATTTAGARVRRPPGGGYATAGAAGTMIAGAAGTRQRGGDRDCGGAVRPGWWRIGPSPRRPSRTTSRPRACRRSRSTRYAA